MSVYGTFGVFAEDGEHPPPLIYRQSHVIPSLGDPRGGSFEIGSIPAFLTRDGRDIAADEDACWPFLRVSLAATEPGEDTVVLDSRQVIALRDALSEWLQRVDPKLCS